MGLYFCGVFSSALIAVTTEELSLLQVCVCVSVCAYWRRFPLFFYALICLVLRSVFFSLFGAFGLYYWVEQVQPWLQCAGVCACRCVCVCVCMYVCVHIWHVLSSNRGAWTWWPYRRIWLVICPRGSINRWRQGFWFKNCTARIGNLIFF